MATAEELPRAQVQHGKNRGKVVRLTVNLSEEVVQALQDLASKNGVTVTEQLRRAISTEKWLEDIRESHKVLVEEGSGRVREVVFK
nr:hypothetical protein OG296_20800 [Streptomyces sp. NBC_01001]